MPLLKLLFELETILLEYKKNIYTYNKNPALRKMYITQDIRSDSLLLEDKEWGEWYFQAAGVSIIGLYSADTPILD